MSVKNLFGLIPHPSCVPDFHHDHDSHIAQAVHDIHQIYTSIFKSWLWISEGILTLIENYRCDNQKTEKNRGLFFVGDIGKKVDSDACRIMGLDPNVAPYFKLIA